MTWHLHIEGQVQGVGFRPFIYQLAHQFGLKGWVNNTTDGVHVEFNGTEQLAKTFSKQIIKQAPRLARISHTRLFQAPSSEFEGFEIRSSLDHQTPRLLLTPDFALCPDCKRELNTESDRRYRYLFITCTNCGPRYSIIQSLPYDRENTSMDVFKMCPPCQEEYGNPLNRRYYSQTNSCNDCGVNLALYGKDGQKLKLASEILPETVAALWEQGKIIAIKGIGGYLLTCDAANTQAVNRLRERKHRPSKPFALMYPNIDQLSKDVNLEKKKIETLESPEAPILLVEKKQNTFNALAWDNIAPGLDLVGVMLPYAPLFECILGGFNRPVIATSGNLSGAPIAFKDDDALKELSPIADLILTHNRKILVPQDDSVLRFSPLFNQKIILRRSRGMAPTFIHPNLKFSDQCVLAMGAMLKSSFGLIQQKNVYLSQYIGDLTNFDTEKSYKLSLEHLMKLLQASPEALIIDKHPDYPSSQLGKAMAEQLGVPLYKVQHHEAHFCAVLGENNLLEEQENVLGVIWDGTGLGDDGHIWGGEFFLYQEHSISRIDHFEYFPFILGDKMPREPRISALSVCKDIPEAHDYLKTKFSMQEWAIYTKKLQQSSLMTSSVGRLFDAVASLLGIMDTQSYEGEAALKLETMAQRYCKNTLDWSAMQVRFLPISEQSSIFNSSLLVKELVEDLHSGFSKAFVAAKFHYALVKMIELKAHRLNIKKIAFSGGVFQNALLVDLIHQELKDTFELYFHRDLSPNDENIAFGQLMFSFFDKLCGTLNINNFS